LLRALETYQPYAPEKVGREREFIVGKHSGRSLIKYLLQQHQLYDLRLVEDIIERVKKGEAVQKYEIFDQLSEHYNSYLGIGETEVISLAKAFRKDKELAGRSGS
jgi:isopropylmalate/homocitrate/citramalate synthase